MKWDDGVHPKTTNHNINKMNRSPPNQQGDHSMWGSRATLTQFPAAKTVYFYKDGDSQFNGLKLAIHPKKYRSFDTLLGELSNKIPGMSFGVRSIYTPHGHDSIGTVDALSHEGHYVCSTHPNHAKGVDIERIGAPHVWHNNRPPSGRRALNSILGQREHESLLRRLRVRRRLERIREPAEPGYPPGNGIVRGPKKITVMKNGDPTERHIVLLNRRTAQNFEQVQEDLSDMFKIAVRKIYTVDGKRVQSLSSIFNGPDVYVVAGTEMFRPMAALSPQPPIVARPRQHGYRTRLVGNQEKSLAGRLRERRERLAKTRGRWKVWVTTNELPSAGTEAAVMITVYGTKGNSGQMQLGYTDGSEHFQSGQIDEFDISVGNIGEIFKIRIGHDNTGEFPNWMCNEVKMKDQDTNEELVFSCKRWLARDEDDGQVCRELPAVRKGEPTLPVIRYDVSVVTGDLWNAGSKANVYITLYGDRGDTGVRQLNSDNKEGFQPGQTSSFHVEAVTLGPLRRIIMGHDGISPGEGLHLEKVIVRDSSKVQHEHTFYCGRWLDVGEDDGKIVRELKVQDEYMADILEKRYWEFEKWKFSNKNQVMFFSRQTGKALRVKPDAMVDAQGDKKEESAIFNVLAKRGMVRVFNSAANANYHLAIDNGKLLGQGKGGAYCEFRVRVQHDRAVMLESIKYPVQHITIMQNGKPGDVRGMAADFSKQFFVYCKGMFRDQGIVTFMTSPSQALTMDHDNEVYGTGKKSRLTQFRVHKVGEGVRMFESIVSPGQYLRLKQGKVDCQGVVDSNSQFIVEKHKDSGFVSLQSAEERGLYVGITPEGKIRPTVNTGVKNINLYPEVVEFGERKVRKVEKTPSPVRAVLPAIVETQRERSPREATPPPVVQRERTPSPEKPKSAKSTEKPQSAKSTKSVKSVKSAKSVYEDGDWKVLVTTSETAQNAEVAIVVYGDKGSSGQIILGSPAVNNLFQQGNTDKFKANLLSLGVVYKIRLELIPVHLSANAAWRAKEVKLQDMNTQELLKFSFDRWMSLKEDDGEIMRELPAVRPGRPVLPVVRYQVLVHTGKEPGSDCEANIFLTMYGERGDTGKRLLHRSNQEQRFQIGQVDEFEVEAVSLGKLEYCVISHDGLGPGQGWYCEQVLVRDSLNADHETVFPCDQWLDTSIGDKKIERKLLASENRLILVQAAVQETVVEEEKPEPGEWKVWVSTGKDKSLSTDHDITLVAYGDQGVSEPITLGNSKEGIFQPATTDEFKINLGTNMGSLYKIRLGHGDLDEKHGWFLDKVKLQDPMSNEQLSFKAGRWLSTCQDDHDTWRELAVVRPGHEPLAVLVYRVEVYTGDVPGADTDATVYIIMYGTRGDTGARVLYHSQTSENKFQGGQVDVFEVEAVSLDEIQRIVIGHSGKGAGAGWFLEKVVVKQIINNHTTEFYFPCGRWFDEGQEDGLIEREILAQPIPADSTGEYRLWIKTDANSLPANGCKATLTAYGEKGQSNEIELCAGGDRGSAFEPGATDEFEIALGDIGELYKIRLAHEDNPLWQGWHLNEVKLEDKITGAQYMFTVDRWLARDKEDYDMVRELPVHKDDKPVLPVLQYEVHVYTGDHWAAGTEVSGYITLYGKKGDSGKRLLYYSTNNKDMLKRKQMDSFIVEAVSLEELTQVVIGHSGTGHGSGWFVEKVVVVEKGGDQSHLEHVFPCGQWLDDHEGDGKIERTLRLLDTVDSKNPPSTKDSQKKTQGQWNVIVKTSDIHNAGTHAQVYLTAYGDKGTSNPQPLGEAKPDSDLFDQGKESKFTINVGDIGELFKLRLEHDNKNDFPSWHVDYLKLQDMDTDEVLVVYVDRWLSEDEQDGQLCREFPITQPDQAPLPVLHYIVLVYTGSQKEAGTDTTIFFNLFGEHGDIGHRPLVRSQTSATLWQPDQVDVFIVEAVSVGILEKVELFHNGKDKGQSWYVEKVVVLESEASLTENLFYCQDWLEVTQGNPVVKKQFNLSAVKPTTHSTEGVLETKSTGSWTIWVHSGAQSEADTQDDIYMVVYGTLGNTEPKLVNQEEQLLSASIYKFQMSVGAIGRIYKVRLYFGGKEQEPSWFLQKMKMKDDDTGQEFHFDYNDWVRSSLDNRDGTTELAAIRPDIPPLPETKYIVSVHTGNHHCSDTDAEIFCTLIGQWGDSGRRSLVTPRKSSEPFQKGQHDEFGITGLDLGQLEKVVIGHSKSGRGQGWFCEKVTVKTLTSPTEQVFMCNRWLDTGCEDRKLVRELLPLATVALQAETDDDLRRERSKGIWTCTVKMTGQDKLQQHTVDLGQPMDVLLVVCGDKGVTDVIPLENSNKLVVGQQQEIQGVKFGDIGKIEKVRVSMGKDTELDHVWMLDELILEDEETKETLRFEFSQWAGQSVSDNKRELPAIRPGQPITPVVPYLVRVYTSSDKDASTFSTVFITLYGAQGDSGKRHLAVNQGNTSKFQAGQVDEFTVESVLLGDLDRVVITKGPGNPWHLDKVVVKEGTYAGSEDIFSYNSWLGELNEQNDEISRTIPLTGYAVSPVAVPKDDVPSLPESQGCWKVQILTGPDQGADTLSTVVLVLCGDKGETDPLPLVSGDKDLFKAGKLDEFTVNVSQDVGDLFKVRVGFAAKLENKGWNLQKIHFLDEDTDDQFSYDLDDWVRVDETRDGWKEFPIIWPAVPVLPVVKYQLWLHLGEVHKLADDTIVYMEMHGERGGTGRRELKKSLSNDNKFEQNQVDQFEVEAVTLMNINKVILGHDCQTAGSGFFLQKVVIKESLEAEREFVFECNRWFDAGEDDNQTERVLMLGAEPNVPPAVKDEQPGDNWKVWTTTSTEPGSGTKSAVALIIYGDKGHSETVVIGEDMDFNFEDGSTQQFDIKVVEDVGEVYKIRVGFHDVEAEGSWFTDYSLAPTWSVDTIKLENTKTGAEYSFNPKMFIKVDGERDYWREFPVDKPNTDEILPVVLYELSVYTGDKFGSGTNANVYLHIFGERGDSGARRLLTSTNNTNKFESGQMDRFTIEAVDLSKLTMVKVGHDGEGAGSGWYLDKVVIRDNRAANGQYVFNCDRWMDVDEDDKATERELTLTEFIPDQDDDKPPTDWQVEVTTSTEVDSGTDAKVMLTVFGDQGDSGPLPLHKDENIFDAGQTDLFEVFVNSEKIGKITKIRLEHDNSGLAPGWRVDKLVMEKQDDKTRLEFPVSKWLSYDETHGDIVAEVPASWPDQDKSEVKNYHVEVDTGESIGGGTDANVYLTIYGEKGDTGKRFLKNSIDGGDLFESGKIDTFIVEAVDLGQLTKVTIGHDGSGPGSGWKLDNVMVRDSEEAMDKIIFHCGQWLDSDEGDKMTERDLIPETDDDDEKEGEDDQQKADT